MSPHAIRGSRCDLGTSRRNPRAPSVSRECWGSSPCRHLLCACARSPGGSTPLHRTVFATPARVAPSLGWRVEFDMRHPLRHGVTLEARACPPLQPIIPLRHVSPPSPVQRPPAPQAGSARATRHRPSTSPTRRGATTPQAAGAGASRSLRYPNSFRLDSAARTASSLSRNAPTQMCL